MAASALPGTDLPPLERPWRQALAMLWRDKFALLATLYLLLMVAAALLGPALLEEAATRMNLRGRNAPPFTLENGWLYVLGADALGRSILARIVVAAQNTLGVAAAAVAAALLIGGTLGLLAGYRGGWLGNLILRLADTIMSFPSLLLAVVVLYVFEPRVGNLVLVLAITRVPVYLRTTRAEVLEIRERLFVAAARVMGAERPAHRAPARRADRPPDADHRRDGRLRLRHAGRIRALVPRHRDPAARDHLGPDGRPGPQLSPRRLVARVLAGLGDHADHARPQPALRLGAARHRPPAALAT